MAKTTLKKEMTAMQMKKKIQQLFCERKIKTKENHIKKQQKTIGIATLPLIKFHKSIFQNVYKNSFHFDIRMLISIPLLTTS